ncbi:MAG TPA: prolipoprotein diacylglyceryl transferase family protein [Gemmataceae bacterium]|nr:prolipoprotein diacylglyceryl transferase family protein [Gemmataceae bacterium]
MRQVLFHIPLKADWLPANLPLSLFLLVAGLALAGLVSMTGRRIQQPILKEILRGAAFWLAGFGVLSAVVVHFAAAKLPQGLPIYGFGMMLFLAFLICTWMAGRRAEGEGVAREHIQDVAIWLFIGGLIGARITFLSAEKHMGFAEMLSEFYKIWDGGIVLYGSVIGGLIGYVFAYVFIFRKYNLSTLKLADILAPSIAVGLCLGRFGCFLNGCCYGQVACPTCPVVYAAHFPLSAPAREGMVEQGYQTAAGFTLARNQPKDVGARVGKVDADAYQVGLRDGDLILRVNDCDIESRDIEEAGKVIPPVEMLTRCLVYSWPRGETQLRMKVRHADGTEAEITYAPRTLGLHPTQLYEVVSMALLFLVLTAYYPLRRRQGQVMAVLMVGYGIHRYLNELLRDDPRPQGFESYTSIVLVVAGIAMWVYLQTRPAPTETAGEVSRESKEIAPAREHSPSARG